MKYLKLIADGVWNRNPILVLGIGMCPTLAVSTSVSNALWMCVATTFVLICSNMLVSMVKRMVAEHVRIPIFITIIASFVTIVELSLKAFQPQVDKALGIYIPLIVVNCIILGRSEEFASKNPVVDSAFDGLGMGIGFGFTLTILAFFREMLGSNKLLGYTLIPGMQPSLVMIMAPGAFFILGFMLCAMNWIKSRKKG